MEIIAVKGYLPGDLKRRAFSAFALRELTFSTWRQDQLQQWLREQERLPGEPVAQSISQSGGDCRGQRA